MLCFSTEGSVSHKVWEKASERSGGLARDRKDSRADTDRSIPFIQSYSGAVTGCAKRLHRATQQENTESSANTSRTVSCHPNPAPLGHPPDGPRGTYARAGAGRAPGGGGGQRRAGWVQAQRCGQRPPPEPGSSDSSSSGSSAGSIAGSSAPRSADRGRGMCPVPTAPPRGVLAPRRPARPQRDLLWGIPRSSLLGGVQK